MIKYDIKKLRNQIEKIQDKKRFEHTLGVASTAQMLATIHGANPTDAYVAGLLHDCAKCLSNEKRLKICKKNHIEVSELELRNPFMLHAKVGRFLAEAKYDIKDEDILKAIESHTTGRPGMSLLEKIVFIADYIEPNRKTIPNLMELRKLSFQDIDQALIGILQNTLTYLKDTREEIDEKTQQTYDYYKERIANT